MKILCCIKQVPDTEANIRLASSNKNIVTDDISWILNPYDEYAVEEAIQIKERLGSVEITAICIGPEKAKEALRSCLALGVDETLHISDPAFENSNPYTIAKVLAKVIQNLEYDLILCGKQAMDQDQGQVGVILANMLNIPHIAVVTKLELSSDGKTLTAHREIEGAVELVECSLPALITAQKGLNEPRYASLKGIMKAKRKEIPSKNLAAVSLSAEEVGASGSKTAIESLSYPPKRPPGRIIGGEVSEAVSGLVKALKEEAKIL